MTSSYRATGHASVRQTPAAALPSAGSWSLNELTMFTPPGSAHAVSPEPTPQQAQIAAEEKARLIDEGYARGLADGERRGEAKAQAQLSEAMAVARVAVAKVNDIASLAEGVLEENIAALAVIVARQIVTREVSLDRELVAELVRRALTEFPIDQAVRIRVNPVDLASLTVNGSSQAMAPITGNRDASWLADARVARGGCLVEGRDRIVDGRVDTALERAYRRMAEIDAS